jgi:Pyruvate/2-oxoacid:ferredoxin oxidoreductase gamma subunit
MAANIILLSAADYIGHFVAEDALEESIRKTVSSRFVELNLKAMRLGLDWARNAAV